MAQDHWLVEGYTLYYSLFKSMPRLTNAKYCSVDSTGIEILGKNGHPPAERLQSMAQQLNTFSQFHEPRKVKKVFLQYLSDFTASSQSRDTLLVVITGHRQMTGYEGGITTGYNRLGNDKVLLPQDVFSLVKRNKGHTTMIVHSCFARMWNVDLSERLSHARQTNGLHRVTMITSSKPEEGIDSHSESRSGFYRGGFFTNCFVGRVLQQSGILLPRRDVLDTQTLEYATVFPEHNIRAGVQAGQVNDESIQNIIDLVRLRDTATPLLIGNSELTTNQLFGLSNTIQTPFTMAHLPNPRDYMNVAPTQTGSAPVNSLPTDLGRLISYYHSLPISASTRSRNVGIEALIRTARRSRSTDDEIQALYDMIRKRCLGIFRVYKIVLLLKLAWPTRHVFPTLHQSRTWKRAEKVAVDEQGRLWLDPSDLLLEALLTGAENNAKTQKALKWAILKTAF